MGAIKKRRANPNLKALTTMERIELSFDPNYEIVLTEHEEECLERWTKAFTLSVKHGSATKVAKKLAVACNISVRHAWREINNSKLLFGEITESSIKAERAIHIERLNKFIEDCYKAKDFDNIARFMKQLGEALGVAKDDPDIIDPSEFIPHNILIGFYPDETGVELPKDLDKQVEQLLKSKKKKNLTNFDLESADAEIIDDGD